MDDLQVRAAATDIFSYLVEFSPSMVREFVMQEAQQSDDVSTVIGTDCNSILLTFTLSKISHKCFANY